MRWWSYVICASLIAAGSISAQEAKKQNEEDFLKARPAIGELLPDVTVYDPNGKEVKTSSLRGHYTVLTFGCLT